MYFYVTHGKMLSCKAVGHTIAQIITQWSLHLEAWLWSQGSCYRILGEQVAMGVGSLPTFWLHQRTLFTFHSTITDT